MNARIRNIKSIQVFSEVCVESNVTMAARTLNISQSSVSYHIKKLEADLGVTLFRRIPKGLELTEEGKVLAQYVGRGLETIQTGLERVSNLSGTVKIALLPMFASRWFSSRLGSFMESHPEINLSIQNHNNRYAHLPNPSGFADLGIQWGLGNWNDFNVHRLWPEKLALVCSPDFLERHRIATPDDLRSCTLIHVDDTRMWDEWFERNCVPRSATQPQMLVEDRHFQLSSTVNGIGVSLFARWLIQDEIQAGTLVEPFGRSFSTSFAYHLIVPKDIAPTKAVNHFIDWLRQNTR